MGRGCKNTETRYLLSFNVRDETRGGKTGEGKGMFKKRIQCSRVFYGFLDSRIILQSGEEIEAIFEGFRKRYFLLFLHVKISSTKINKIHLRTWWIFFLNSSKKYLCMHFIQWRDNYESIKENLIYYFDRNDMGINIFL